MKITQKEYIQEWKDALYPKNKKIWVQIEPLDQGKCFDLFRLNMSDERKTELGFDVHGIGYKEVEPPQVAALADMKMEVVMAGLDADTEKRMLEFINNKMAQLKQQYIVQIDNG